MSYFATSSAYSYADHPFSYSVRRQSALSRVLDVVLPARRNTDRSPSSLLHDQALTAQPPVLKRSGTKTRVISSETVWAVTEEVVVSVAIAVAAGFFDQTRRFGRVQVLVDEQQGNYTRNQGRERIVFLDRCCGCGENCTQDSTSRLSTTIPTSHSHGLTPVRHY